jgi:riboflavin biosynthesis pyrimidine reductase
MVGVNTVIVDDPMLTSRPGGVESERQMLRVVVGTAVLRIDDRVVRGLRVRCGLDRPRRYLQLQ